MKILIIHFGALGDLLLSRLSLLSLRDFFKQAEFHFIGHSYLVSLIKEEMDIKHIYEADKFLFLLYQKEGKKLWEKYDKIVIFARKFPCQWQENLKNVPTLFIQTIPAEDIKIPIFEFQFNQIRRCLPIEGKLSFKPLKVKNKRSFTFDLLIHPGSGSPFKNWPAKNFVKVIRHFAHFKLGLISGPADEAPTQEIVSQLGEASFKLSVLRGHSLPEIARIIKDSKAYLGNDSGISHLAAAVGTSSFIIFGPTDFHLWRPWGETTIFAPKIDCAPCDEVLRRKCPHRKCLEQIRPEEVIATLKRHFCL